MRRVVKGYNHIICIFHKYWEHPRAPYYNEREEGGKQRMQAVKLHAHKKDARPACTHMHPQDAD